MRIRILILIILLINLPSTDGIITPDATISPYLDEIVGTVVSDSVYANASTLQIRYIADSEISTLWLVITGSGYDNDSVEMSYQSTSGDIKKFSMDILITGYTTFYAYDMTDDVIGNSEVYPANELDIQFHRIWIYDERYPELESIANATRDGDHYQRSDTGVTIRYSIRTASTEPIQLLYGPHRELITQNTEPMIYVSNSSGYMYYEYNLTITDRELWFTTNSHNSYEYNDQEPYKFSSHMIGNGFSVGNVTITSDRNENKTIDGRITGKDTPEIYLTVSNSTGVESLVPSSHIFYDRDNGTVNIPLDINTELVNTSDGLQQYKLTLPKITWGSKVAIDLIFHDDSINKTVYYSHSISFSIGKWGPFVYFEHSVMYTHTGDLTVNFVINDVDEVGMHKIQLSTVFKNYTIPIGQHNASISLGDYFGSSMITLNATNKKYESEIVYLQAHYDITKPEVTDIEVVAEANRYRLKAHVSDNLENGTGIRSIRVDIGGVVFDIQDIYNTTDIEVDEFILLRPGNNTISLIVEDMAGNQQISTIYYITAEEAETTSTPFSMIIMPIITMVIIRRVRK